MKIFALITIVFISFCTVSKADELNTIKQNYKQTILSDTDDELIKALIALPKEQIVSDQMVVELMERYPYNTEYVNQLINTLQSDGSWNDINYEDKARSGWLPKNHANRILDMAKIYSSKNSAYYKSPEITNALKMAMNFWFQKKLICPNWWYNQIGVPKTLGAAFILLEDELSNNEKQNAIEVMNHSKFGMTGQNKTWLAGNVLIRAMLQNDYELIKAARDTIFSEIVTGKTEGIKTDHSFHQHGAQQQFGNYGTAYISGMAFWGKVFANTSLALNKDKLDIISDLVNKGYRHILWNGYMDVNALGRQFFRHAQRHKAFSIAFSSQLLAQIDTANRWQYQSLLASNFNLPSLQKYSKPYIGSYHFWQSDQTVHRRQQWMVSVKMSSPRVTGSEAGNGDNLKGFYLADGATYTYVNGDEYNNIFPVWDWRKIPGTTTYSTTLPLKQLDWGGYNNNNAFVGNVNNGNIGLTAMHFNREGIDARKAWICTNNFVICLGAGITADSGCVVTTTIEQSLKKSNPMYLNGVKWENINYKEWKNSNNQRFFYNNTGYIVLSNNNGYAITEEKTGDWHYIMNTYPKGTIDKKDVFTLYIDHGIDPKDANYQYLIIPASNSNSVKEFNLETVKILHNDKNIQVIDLPDDRTTFIAAYTPSEIVLPNNISFQNIEPGLFIINYTPDNKLNIHLSDPTQLLKTISFKINGKTITATLPSNDKKGSTLTMNINKNLDIIQ